MRRLWVWGAGELGGRVAKAWVAAGGEAIGCTLSTKRHADLLAAGVAVQTSAPAPTEDDVLVLALPGSDRQSQAVLALVSIPVPARVILISSTSYHGTAHGVVKASTRPGRGPRADAAAIVESAFEAWAGDRGVILRMAGLWHSTRGPMNALKNRGFPPKGPPNSTLALIHYADAATATVNALTHASPRPIYLCVTEPCPLREEFYMAGCVMLALPPPQFTRALKNKAAIYEVQPLRDDLLPEVAHPKWQEALIPV